MYKSLLALLFLAPCLTLSAAVNRHFEEPKLPVITLYQQPNFSFKLSIPEPGLPSTVSGLEKLHTYNHLKDRMSGSGIDTLQDAPQRLFSDVSTLMQQINALSLEFKWKF